MDYETKRLSELGISSSPRWISLDDNSAGYDVYSYDKGPIEPIAKLIEVKSTTRQPTEFTSPATNGKPQWNAHHTTISKSGFFPSKRLIELTRLKSSHTSRWIE